MLKIFVMLPKNRRRCKELDDHIDLILVAWEPKTVQTQLRLRDLGEESELILLIETAVDLDNPNDSDNVGQLEISSGASQRLMNLSKRSLINFPH